MTLDQGLAARVISGIRTNTAQRHGCGEWDAHGIAKALAGTEGPPGAVLAAAALAAEDPSLRLPSPAGFTNHWPVNASTTRPAPSNNTPCPDHGDPMPCHHQDHAGDMTLEQITAAAEKIRTMLRSRT